MNFKNKGNYVKLVFDETVKLSKQNELDEATGRREKFMTRSVSILKYKLGRDWSPIVEFTISFLDILSSCVVKAEYRGK